MNKIRTLTPGPTPLQEKLNELAELIAKIGGVMGLTLSIALLICFFVQLGTNEPAWSVSITSSLPLVTLTYFHSTPNEKGITCMQILIISVTLVIVALPGGLLLAVTLSLQNRWPLKILSAFSALVKR